VSTAVAKILYFFDYRNNSAKELSAFAESAMEVNRVVLQHFSLNMDMSHLSCATQARQHATHTSEIFGLADPSKSGLAQRRLLRAQSLSKENSGMVVPTG
jgi:MAP kinase interacting serine/threonine kinase